MKALDAYAEAFAKARQSLRAGLGLKADAREALDGLWRAVSQSEVLVHVADWHAQAGLRSGEPSPALLQAAFPNHVGPTRQWLGVTGPFGITALRPMPGNGGDSGDGGGGGGGGGANDGGPAPAPAPAPPPPAPHSPPPMRIMTVAPYERAYPDSATSGVADLHVQPSATVSDGRLSLASSAFAPVFAGGGTDSRALLGTTMKWPEGYAQLSMTATIRLDQAYLWSLTVLGGATASAELLMTASLSIGGDYARSWPLGAAVAPAIWHTELNVPGTFTVRIDGIMLNGLAGEVDVRAGIHDNTAAVGVVGSSAALTMLSGQLTSIQLDLS
ncbi:hypothetical protein [Pelomonas cellulosilytica]|uniref:Uncharacterized protein n=1 Tax=Pelomonas cellulosilytica TaxID=2906762 RepID=A0ABS8XVZ6_9BURK|nr:hypothetical protein [Pelomonas sp. P8]MCE4554811.1 hypothetical protein [Pelomonas sp. P8]